MDGVLTTLAKWLYLMMAIFSFPLMIAPAKSAIINLCPFDLDQYTATVIVVLSSVILNIFITDLSTVSKTYIKMWVFDDTFHICRFQLGLVF